MRATTKFLSGMYAVTGVLHFAVPRVYDDIIPVPLGRWDRELTYLSGVAELACAAGLATLGAAVRNTRSARNGITA